MRRFIVAGVAFIGILLPSRLVLGQAETASSPPPGGAAAQWKTTLENLPGNRPVVREMTRGYPDSGGTRPAQTQPDNPERIASRFVFERADLWITPLGIAGDPTNSLRVKEVIATPNRSEFQDRGTDHTVVYSQHHKGIPVFGSSMTVSMTQHGDVWSVVNGLSLVDPKLPTRPKLSPDAALARVRDVLGDPSASPDREGALYVMAPSHLAWRFNFLRPHFKEIFVDAMSGDVLLQRSNIRN